MGNVTGVTRHSPTRIALLALAGFAAAYLVSAVIGFGPRAANESAIGEVSRWCERVRSGPLREPVNTLGNLGFIVAGLAMFRVLAADRDGTAGNEFYGHRPMALLYAGAVVFLGPGSMVMHGTHTFFGAWIDNVSMVTYILIPWLFNVALLARWRKSVMFRAYAALLGGYAVLYWSFGSDLGVGLDLFGLSIGLWIISEVLYVWWSPAARVWSGLVGFGVAAAFGIFPAEMIADPGEFWWVMLFWIPGLLATGPPSGRRRYTPWFWAGISSFLLAYAIWLTGTDDHSWCRPDSLLQAHAVWHLLTAVATWCFFKFLRTERTLVDQPDETPVPSSGR
jgi:hypothetical protein